MVQQVPAKIKINGKQFEVIVDCEKAMEFKKNKPAQNISALRDILQFDGVFYDYKKGLKASESDLTSNFNTTDVYTITQKIINDGEIELTQEYRNTQRELKLKQIIAFLARNCADPRTGAPYTIERITTTIKQTGAKIDENRDVEEQALAIIKQIEKILPLRISTKRIKIVVPSQFTGNIYNLFKEFKKESEEWLADGSMSVIINLPAGMQLEFYDKLNKLTHGNSITEEIK